MSWHTASLRELGLSTMPMDLRASSCLSPLIGREQWPVVTRWRDEESFQAWLNSDSFTHAHRSAAERRGHGTPTAIATHSEVWSYVRADSFQAGHASSILVTRSIA